MPLLKTADELMDLGHDRVLRGDFRTAADRYSEAARKFAKDGNQPAATVASAYANLTVLGQNPSPADYKTVANSLAQLGGMPMKLGPRQIPASVLSHEASLLAEDKETQSMRPTTPAEHDALAKRFQALSMGYRQMGNQPLILPEIFQKESVSTATKAPYFAALAEEEMGESLIGQDPKRAAEHNQNARNWWMQAGNSERAQAAANRVNQYGRSVKCWFCGREVTGEGIQFVALPGEMGPWSSSTQGSGLVSADLSRTSVYACKGCQSTIDRVADERALQRASEAEARMNAKIEALRRRIPGA
jgi:hypothetical protein